MKVRAKSDGYYNGQRVRSGQVFDLLPGHKLGAWMESAEKPVPERPAIAIPTTISAINKQQIAEQDALVKRKGG